MYYEKAKKIEDYIINWRRHFHENPELSTLEFETIKSIKEELKVLGIDFIEVPDGGILGFIKGNLPGDKKVLLRADVDALPVVEKENNLAGPRTCISKNVGVMHACGHDGHTAMLLGAAKLLVEEKDTFGGEVILCFERGEEGYSKYREILAYMEKFHIVPDAIWAIHLVSTLETGVFGIRDDSMMAGSIFFEITLEGQGGHGSRPDQAINPISAFTAIYNYFETIRLVKMDPFETLSYSIGTVNAGVASNVIPQTLNFKGTVRFMDREKIGMPFYLEFKDKLEKLANAYDCKVNFDFYPKPGFPVVNDKTAAVWSRNLLAKEFGEDNVTIPEPWMASESFAGYLTQWPGVYAFLGVKNEEKGIGAAHHNEYFDIDEDVLAMGTAGSVMYAINFLNSDLVLEDRPLKGNFREYLKEVDETEENIERLFSVDKQEIQ
ncbi:MAG: amidohydrolase [Tissierellia bacterium]|jgi:amidohydrolase|nr:amidohydrolase [Tissierellia bacterium]